ncbi:MAG TPA: hypothetical protein VL068_13125 [Microthrixaceae bacterium]|nr:hypothetical protein [Microthrixaceae bacterium]
MSGSAENSKRSGLFLRLFLFTLVSVGMATLIRKWALSKSDHEFEARLRAADEVRG